MAGLADRQQPALHSQFAALLAFELPDDTVEVEEVQACQGLVLEVQRPRVRTSSRLPPTCDQVLNGKTFFAVLIITLGTLGVGVAVDDLRLLFERFVGGELASRNDGFTPGKRSQR